MFENEFKLKEPPSCPTCSAVLDGCSTMHDDSEGPQPGDPTICIKCSDVLVFTEGMGLRRIEKKDLAAMPREIVMELGMICEAMKVLKVRQN